MCVYFSTDMAGLTTVDTVMVQIKLKRWIAWTKGIAYIQNTCFENPHKPAGVLQNFAPRVSRGPFERENQRKRLSKSIL